MIQTVRLRIKARPPK